MGPTFIAETDAEGHILWVWRQGYGEAIARPVRDPSQSLVELRQGTVHGATGEAVSAWFQDMATRGGSDRTPDMARTVRKKIFD